MVEHFKNEIDKLINDEVELNYYYEGLEISKDFCINLSETSSQKSNQISVIMWAKNLASFTKGLDPEKFLFCV